MSTTNLEKKLLFWKNRASYLRRKLDEIESGVSDLSGVLYVPYDPYDREQQQKLLANLELRGWKYIDAMRVENPRFKGGYLYFWILEKDSCCRALQNNESSQRKV